MTLERDGDVFILHLGEGDIRFDPESIERINVALDEVTAAAGPTALVTAASGKIWSNGLDLDHLGSLGDDFMGYIAQVESIYARYLELPMPTVAAMQGHAFAGGAMFALAHDVRIMRADRGYLCLPEVDLGMPFTDGMAALISAKVPQPARHRLALLGERMSAPTALELGVIDAVAPEAEVLTVSVERAGALASKAAPVLSRLRRGFYGTAIDSLGGI